MKPAFWRDFTTKKSLTEAIRAIVTPKPFYVPFDYALLSDLIFERHYFCSLRGLRPSRFRKLPGFGAYNLEGDFNELHLSEPISWHPVSWTKCLLPPLTNWERIVRAMRDRCEYEKTRYRSSHALCESCRTSPSREVHHKEPSFKQLCESVRSQISASDIDDALGRWNWFHHENFSLPDAHRITCLFDELHSRAKLEALCRECHNRTKRKPPT